MDFLRIETDARAALAALLDGAGVDAGDIVAVGCSTSEVAGKSIGSAGSPEVAEALLSAILPELNARGLYLAAQCCEHLNRALVVERECARLHRLEIVSAVPHPHAGGSFATCAYRAMKDAVLVERVAAVAGMDIGETLIGMHLKRVAVPVRAETRFIGEARLALARSRPPLIGGARAKYG